MKELLFGWLKCVSLKMSFFLSRQFVAVNRTKHIFYLFCFQTHFWGLHAGHSTIFNHKHYPVNVPDGSLLTVKPTDVHQKIQSQVSNVCLGIGRQLLKHRCRQILLEFVHES